MCPVCDARRLVSFSTTCGNFGNSARVHVKSPERTSEQRDLNQRQHLPNSYISATTASYDAKLQQQQQHRSAVDATPTTGMFTPGVRSTAESAAPRQSSSQDHGGSSPFSAARATPHPPASSSSAAPSSRHRRSVQRTRGERDDETLQSGAHSTNNGQQVSVVEDGEGAREDLEAKRAAFTQQLEETRASALKASRRLTTGSATPQLERNKARFSAKAEVLNKKMRESLSRTESSVRLFDSTV